MAVTANQSIIYREEKGPLGNELYNLTPQEVDGNFKHLDDKTKVIATTTQLGVFKPDGTTITVDPITGIGSATGGTTGTIPDITTENVSGLPYTTLKKTTFGKILHFLWDGVFQHKPVGATAPDFTWTQNTNGSVTINAVDTVPPNTGQIDYYATGELDGGTALPTPSAPASQTIDDANNLWLVALVSGYPNISDYEYEQINS